MSNMLKRYRASDMFNLFLYFGSFIIVLRLVWQYCEKQEFPFQVVPHIASLSIGGSWTKVSSMPHN